MKYKKTIILLAFVVFLLSIAGVSASEIDNTIASENANTIELSTDNDIEDNLQTSEENEALASTDYDEAIAQTDTEVLGADSATYFDLAQEIGHSGNITLTHKNYTYNEGATAITIVEENKVIDGNGAVIDMNGSTIRAFYISASGVTIKNLTIKNANSNDRGGAIYFSSTGTVTNCNFTGNKATRNGGAVYFYSTGNVTNCNFTDNSATVSGGAVYFYSTGTVTNCNFTNNTASGDDGGAIRFGSTGNVSNCNFVNNSATGEASWGGAVYFEDSGTVTNCNFVDNKATGVSSRGGAVYFSNKGTVTNCNFADNSASRGGAIFSNQWYTTADTCIFKRNSGDNMNTVIYPPTLNVDDFTTVYGSGEKLTFDLKTNSSIPVTNGNILISVYFKDNGEWVRNYTCLSGEGWIPDLPVGSYIAVFNTEYAEFQKINRTIRIIPNIKFYANVTSAETNNRTVNITAKSNIPQDILEGKLLFILPNGTEIEATYGGNSTWWRMHTFADYDVYQVNATYEGLDNVTLTNATITINKADSTITMDNITLDYGQSINVTAATTGATGITAKIDGKDITVINNFTIQISGLNGGNHTLEVTTIADEDHNPVTETVNVIVNKVASQVIVQDLTMGYQDQQSLVVNVKDSQGNPITHTYVNITINGITYNCWVDGNGTASLPIELRANTYTADIKFENGNYNVSASTAKVTVKKTTPKITAKAKTFKKSVKTKKYTITLKDNTGKAIKKAKVTLKVKGKTYTAKTNSKGKATFKIKNLTKKGKYTAVIKYKGNGNYNKVTKKVKLTVKN